MHGWLRGRWHPQTHKKDPGECMYKWPLSDFTLSTVIFNLVHASSTNIFTNHFHRHALSYTLKHSIEFTPSFSPAFIFTHVFPPTNFHPPFSLTAFTDTCSHHDKTPTQIHLFAFTHLFSPTPFNQPIFTHLFSPTCFHLPIGWNEIVTPWAD